MHFRLYIQYIQKSEIQKVPLELKEVDEALRRNGNAAALRIVGCAGMLRILPEQDVAMCTELQGVAVLFFIRVTPAQLKVHLFPFELTLF